jgi:hypothetical protein
MEPVAGMHGILVSSEMGGQAGAEVFELTQDISRTADRIMSFASNRPSRSSVQALAAVQALSLAATAFLSSVDAQCDLDQPPTSLDTRPRGQDHRLITRCQHDPPHCWEGTVFIACPAP